MFTLRHIILFQGSYYFLTGLWPLIHLRSFELITGDKKEHWLVYTVALMIVSTSILFLYDGIESPEIYKGTILVSIMNCLFLAWIDIYFSVKKVIRKVYLLDAGVQVIILFELFMHS